jgi:hypothetical protein
MKLSSLILQANAPEGNEPHFLPSAKREDPSQRFEIVSK